MGNQRTKKAVLQHLFVQQQKNQGQRSFLSSHQSHLLLLSYFCCLFSHCSSLNIQKKTLKNMCPSRHMGRDTPNHRKEEILLNDASDEKLLIAEEWRKAKTT